MARLTKQKIDIEALVIWAIVRQAAKLDDGRLDQEYRHLSGRARSSTASLEGMLQLGTRIQGGGSSDHRTPADALTVAMAIDRLPIEQAALIAHAARSGSPPDWGPEGVGCWLPVMDRRGNQRKLWQDRRAARGLLGWEWVFEGLPPDAVDRLRMAYWDWWHALVTLRVRLDGVLVEWDVTGPGRLLEPWNAAKPKIHLAP